jgi:hypothetical protein
MLLRKTIYPFLLLLFSFSFALPQNMRQVDRAKQPKENQTEVEPKALALLERVVEESQLLKLAENRTYIKATIADTLWSKDEKHSRILYKEVAAEIISFVNDNDEDEQENYQRIQWLMYLRNNIINQISQKDPEFALDFLRDTRQLIQQSSGYTNSEEQEAQLEFRLNSLIAAKDPKLSLKLARESLKKGIQYELINILQNLRSKDKESYAILLKEILDKLKGMNLATDQNASNVAMNLLSVLRPQEGEEAAYKELITTLVSAAAKASTRSANPNEIYTVQYFLNSLRSRISEIEKYTPEQMPALKRKFAEMDESADPYTKANNALNQLSQNGTVEDILEAASKVPKEYRSQYYSQAAWKAIGQGDFQRAIQIAESDGISPAQSKQLLQQINSQRFYKLINEGKVAEARQSIALIKNTQESIQILIQLANAVAGKDDKTTALQILREANDLIGGQPKNQMEMYSKFQLSRAYASLNPDSSFEMIASLLPQLNDLVASASALSGFENQYLKDGEWQMMNTGGSVGNLVSQCHQQIAELARKDFDRAVNLAENFQRNEIRLKALLSIAQTTLSKTY